MGGLMLYRVPRLYSISDLHGWRRGTCVHGWLHGTYVHGWLRGTRVHGWLRGTRVHGWLRGTRVHGWLRYKGEPGNQTSTIMTHEHQLYLLCCSTTLGAQPSPLPLEWPYIIIALLLSWFPDNALTAKII